MPPPQVSVIIPCYYDAGLLAQCLESLRSQSLEAWEAILVDDAGPASSEISELVDAVADPRIRLIKHDSTRGAGACRNTGVAFISSDKLVFVDDDDMLHPDFLRETLGAFEIDSTADVVVPQLEKFGAGSGVLEPDKPDLSPELLALNYHIPGAGVVMKKSVWDQVQGFSEHLELLGMEDRDFWICASGFDLNIHYIKRPLYYWRRHPDSTSKQLPLHEYAGREIVVARHRQKLERVGILKAYLAEGYIISTKANLRARKRRQAILIALKGLARFPGHPELRSLLVRSVLPESVRRIRRTVDRRLGGRQTEVKMGRSTSE